MNKAEAYIADAWRAVNASRVTRGCRPFDIHDRELFCLGLRAAATALMFRPAEPNDIIDIAEKIERSRG